VVGVVVQRAAVAWRYIVATEARLADFERLVARFVEGNWVCAQAAPALTFGRMSLNFSLNGRLNANADYDLGLASAILTLKATARGLSVHQMFGFLRDTSRELYRVPDGFRPLTGLAIGYPADAATLP
jgi:hypothetical protein